MAKQQKKATQNAPRTRELLAPKGEPVSTPPAEIPTPAEPTQVSTKGEPVSTPPADIPPPAEPTQVSTKGDGFALPPSVLSDQETLEEAHMAGPTPRILVNAVSVEAGLYLLLFIAALLMRFTDLGARPLGQQEAAVAIAAWQFLQGQATGFIGSPFLFSTNLFLFFLGGPTDTTVRILPALIGSALVLLPALLRRELGRTGALISSVLLLFSSTLVFFSRDANGVEISAVTGFAAAICIWRYVAQGRAHLLYMGLLAAAISLTASAAGFTLLLAGVVFAPFFRWLVAREENNLVPGQAYPEGPVSAPLRVPSTDRQAEWRNAVLIFAATYVAVATAFTTNRAGLAAALDLFGVWLASFHNLGPLTSPLDLLPIYEPLTLVFGFAGLLFIPSLRGEDLRSRGVILYFATVLVLGGILYSVSGDKSPVNVVVLVVPLAILAGWLIGSLLERSVLDIAKAGGWRAVFYGELPVVTLALGLVALIYLQLVTLLQQNRFSPNIEALRQLLAQGPAPGEFETAMILLGIFTLAVGAFLVFLAIASVGSTRAANIGSLIVVLLVALAGVHALWLANFSGPEPVNEFIAGEQTSLQARDLVQDLEWLSEWRGGDPHTIQVRADESLGPVVRWYLRAFKNLQWVRQPQADAPGEALLTTAEAPAPAGVWIDQHYRLQMDWQPQGLTGEVLWKWLVFRDGGVQDWQYVKLWAPNPE